MDFYVLEDPQKSVHHLACQLAMMAWEQGMKSMLLLADQGQIEQLDQLMWVFPKGRFLPHQPAGQPGDAPVVLGTHADLDHPGVQVVINLDTEVIARPERFRRLLELVPAKEADRQASRVKFRVYKEQGLRPASHSMVGS